MPHRALAILQLITAVLIILFWILFFTVGTAPPNPPNGYYVYQLATPLPDAFMVSMLISGAIGLLQGKTWGRVLSLVGAGGLIYLGFADFSFNIENGLYTVSVKNFIFTAAQQLWSVGFGVAIIYSLRKG